MPASVTVFRVRARSYHAVTSWSRVKGMGIPLWKAVEVTLIWLLAVVLAVPEALAFDMLEIPYRGNKLRVCLLHPEQTISFMKVGHSRRPSLCHHNSVTTGGGVVTELFGLEGPSNITTACLWVGLSTGRQVSRPIWSHDKMKKKSFKKHSITCKSHSF